MQEILIFFIVIINLFFIFNLKKISNFFNIYDYPDNYRKFQKTPVALLGGFFFVAILLIFLLLSIINNDFIINNLNFNFKEFLFFLIFAFLIFILGLADDKIEISSNIKLILIFLILLIYLHLDKSIVINEIKFLFLDNPINLNNLAIPFTVLSILLFINAFNMFDGINLQCGIYSLSIFIIFFVFGNYKLLSIIFIIQIIFFLYLNYNNKIYLGDSGSLLLGFIISILFIKNYNLQDNFLYADQIFIIMMIPGFDLLRLALQRLISGKHPFSADTNHLHHYLLNHYGLYPTITIIQIILIIPFLLSLYLKKTIFIILVFLIIYVYIVSKYKKN